MSSCWLYHAAAFPSHSRWPAPLDVFVVRKLGVPGHEELAMGAVARGGVRVLNELLVRELDGPAHVIEAVATREEAEIERRERLYCTGRPFRSSRGGP